MSTQNPGEILKDFYAAVVKRDMQAARQFLHPDLIFVGLFETYRSVDQYLDALTKLMGIVVRLDIKTIVAERDEAAIFFDLVSGPPINATTLVAEWHKMRDGKIAHVESAFDGRPFAAMFVTHRPTNA